MVAERNRGAAYLTLFLANTAVVALLRFLTYYFQRLLTQGVLLTQVDGTSPYTAWVLPGLILIGTGIG